MFLREFVLGANATGSVHAGGVVGGENATLASAFLPGQREIYVGAGATASAYVYPSAAIAAWESYMASAASATPTVG